jgi:hypothetical protein
MDEDAPLGLTMDDLKERWKVYIDQAAADEMPALTTLESFAGDGAFLVAALTYAHERAVDVMVAAESDGTFF